MVLTGMIALDEDAVICDLAETYGVFDLRALPLSTVATLAFGLRENSRIKSKLAGYKVSLDTILAVKTVDLLENLRWMRTEDGHKGTNPPKMLLPEFIERKETKTGRFKSPDEFEQFRSRFFR